MICKPWQPLPRQTNVVDARFTLAQMAVGEPFIVTRKELPPPGRGAEQQVAETDRKNLLLRFGCAVGCTLKQQAKPLVRFPGAPHRVLCTMVGLFGLRCLPGRQQPRLMVAEPSHDIVGRDAMILLNVDLGGLMLLGLASLIIKPR